MTDEGVPPPGDGPAGPPDTAPPPPPVPQWPAATPPPVEPEAAVSPAGQLDWGSDPGAPGAALSGPRPVIRIGSVLVRTVDTFIANPVPFLVLAIPSALLSLLYLVTGTDPRNPWAIVLILVGDIVAIVFGLAIIVAGDQARTTASVSVGAAVGRALGRSPIAILSIFAELFAFVGIAIAIAIVFGVVSLARIPLLSGIAGLIGIGFVAFVLVRWLLAQAAVVLDEVGPVAALNRSWALTRGNVLRFIGLGIVIALITLPLGIGVGLLTLTLENPLLIVFVSAAVTLVTAPLAGILTAIVYGDLVGRPTAPAVKPPNAAARWALIGGLVVVGVVGGAIAIPNLGPAVNRLAVASIPAANRGQILFGTGRDSGNNCQPTGAKTTFSSGETIYIGGYFTKPIPAGSTGSVAIYVNGVIAGSAPLGDASKAVICYYEVDPLVGAQPGTYRINVSLAGETIADGQVVVQ